MEEQEQPVLSFEFALYYVIWPFLAGMGTIYLALFHQEWFYYALVGWGFVWLVWPIGLYRRRYMNQIVETARKEAEETGEPPSVLPFLGIPLLMFLALWAGLQVAPFLLEEAGVDVTARLKEIQADVERERHSQPSEVPSSGAESRKQPQPGTGRVPALPGQPGSAGSVRQPGASIRAADSEAQ